MSTDTVVENLILDLLARLTDRDRSYEEVMEAWRTSCPRLPMWEDANDLGLVSVRNVNGRCVIRVTPLGLEPLHSKRSRPATATIAGKM